MMQAKTGNRLWQELHAIGAATIRTQKMFFAKWIVEVGETLGCASCFRKLLWFMEKWPVAYGEGFYLWSICLHDYVNKDLGRKLFYPELTLEPLREHGIVQ